MRKYWKQFATITLSGLLLLTGCSSDAQPTGENTTENAKELTPIEVLEKANEAMGKNVTYEMNMTQKIDIDANGTKVNDQLTMNMTMNMVDNNYHAKGNMTAQGQQIPVEMYLVDNTLYQNSSGTGWTKITMAGSSSAQQDPSAPMKELAKLIEKLGGNVLPKGITVKNENNAYLVEINYNEMSDKEETTKEFKEQFIAGFKASAPAELASTLTPDKIQLDKNIFKIHIDEKTFQATKMEQEVIIGMNTDLFKLKTDILTTLDLKGEFKGTIEVPEDVKNNAKSIGF